jgi:hypothetical protein
MSSKALKQEWWLFSPKVDLGVFLGSAIISFIALFIGAKIGVLKGSTPDWVWVPAVLLIDVAHVYSTGFRVYLDNEELKRRPWLYILVPVIALVIGILLYSQGELTFWRTIAYLAVFHFIRQQYGWVALYRAKLGERDSVSWWIDALAIYSATIFPLIYWHTHLPRKFWWFLTGDFLSIPIVIYKIAEPIYYTSLALYLLKTIYCGFFKNHWNPGKDIILITTVLCWYVGIIGYNSDYAFTVTNVIIHGVPYLALVYWYSHQRCEDYKNKGVYKLFESGPVNFLLLLWALAYVEELLWDKGVWQERNWLFGAPWDFDIKFILVPLLALPQITHYILDGFIWKRKSNPTFSLVSSVQGDLH